MRIDEVEFPASSTPAPDKLMALVSFLAGRAKDTNSQKQISQDAFISLARNLSIQIDKSMLPEIVGQPPLSNILEPLDPGSTEPITFKSDQPEGPTEMPVNKAQDIVANAAKKAASKDRDI